MFGWLRKPSRPAAVSDEERLFEGFTESSHRIVALTREEARHLNHEYADTGHLLLGLLREEGNVAATVLRSFGVELDEVREQIETILGHGANPVRGRVDLAPRFKKVLEMARLEARQLDNDYVGPEHLLLGLMRETEGTAARVLGTRGIHRDEIRRSVSRTLESGE